RFTGLSRLLKVSGLAEYIRVHGHLLTERRVVPDSDRAKATILERVPHGLVVGALLRGVVAGTVDEDADAGQTVALIVEVRLRGDIGDGAILGAIGEPESVLVQVVDERLLQARRGIDPLTQPAVLLRVVPRRGGGQGIGPAPRPGGITHQVATEEPAGELV